jgi:hypothetical protein
MKKFLLLLSFTLFFYVNPIITKDANAVVLKSDTPCSETGYKYPCNCLNESSWAKKRICNFRAGIKKEDYVPRCADRSEGYSDAIAKEVFKSCMHKHGF